MGNIRGLPPHERRRRLRAIFAKMEENQRYLTGAQRSLRAASTAVLAAESFTSQKFPMAKAYLSIGQTVAGLPAAAMATARRARKIAKETKELKLQAENMKIAQQMAARRLPFPGKGSQGRWSAVTDLIPPDDYIRWDKKGRKFKKYYGMYLPPEMHAKLGKMAPKAGRPPGSRSKRRKRKRASVLVEAQKRRSS